MNYLIVTSLVIISNSVCILIDTKLWITRLLSLTNICISLYILYNLKDGYDIEDNDYDN